MTRPSLQGLLRISEAARFLDISRSKLYRLMHTGELPFVKLGKARRLTVEGLNQLVERHTHHGQKFDDDGNQPSA